jgi:TM2 domain-containing membrane protein YozV
MQGQVLDYSVQLNSGVISGADGARYTFAGAEWREDLPPTRGMVVDFDAKDKSALAIYRGLGHSGMGNPGSKSKAAATLWAIFLGGFGAHKFYMGSWGWGIVYLLTCWLYVPFFVALVEWIRYVLMTDDEFYIKSEQFKDKGAFGFFW